MVMVTTSGPFLNAILESIDYAIGVKPMFCHLPFNSGVDHCRGENGHRKKDQSQAFEPEADSSKSKPSPLLSSPWPLPQGLAQALLSLPSQEPPQPLQPKATPRL